MCNKIEKKSYKLNYFLCNAPKERIVEDIQAVKATSHEYEFPVIDKRVSMKYNSW